MHENQRNGTKLEIIGTDYDRQQTQQNSICNYLSTYSMHLYSIISSVTETTLEVFSNLFI